MTRRTTIAATAALALLTVPALAGCGGNDPKADPTPSATATSPSVTASPTRPAWAAKYTDAEYADYQAALARYQDYLAHNKPINDADPHAAVPVLQKYFAADEAAYQLNLVRFWNKHQVKVVGNPRVLWSKATGIADANGSPRVALRQCIDFTGVKTYQGGKLVTAKPLFDGPVEESVALARPGAEWVITRLANPSLDPSNAVKCS